MNYNIDVIGLLSELESYCFHNMPVIIIIIIITTTTTTTTTTTMTIGIFVVVTLVS
jgi:hypothetical protein